MLTHPLLAENSLFKLVGEIFHPLFELFGYILAGLYSVWPNYGFAITGLTILIMLALTPVTVKSTKSMLAMQRLQPEMKKLQAKYKGPENREHAQPGDDAAVQGQRHQSLRGLPAEPPADALPHRPVLAHSRALLCRAQGFDLYQHCWTDNQVHGKGRVRVASLHPDGFINAPSIGGQ